MSIENEKVALDRERLEVDKLKVKVDERRAEIDENRLAYEPVRLQYEAEALVRVASAEATIKFADITIRSLLILNGGAALAVLSFASNIAKTGGSNALASSVFYFGIGAACSVATAALSYFAQSFFTHVWEKSGYLFQGLAIIFGGASMATFTWGMIDAARRLGGG